MKASAFNGDVEIFFFREFLSASRFVSYTATSVPTKRRND